MFPLETYSIQPGLQTTHPCYSPDGRYLAVRGFKNGRFDIYIYNLSTKSVTPLTNDKAVDGEPIWSPDGKYIYFYSDREAPGGIWKIPVSNGKATGSAILVSNPSFRASQPSISPNGLYLAYHTSRGGQNHIWYVQLSTGNEFQVTKDYTQNFAPTWSRDSQWLVIQTKSGNDYRLYKIHRGGTSRKEIRLPGDSIQYPRLTYDGRRIIAARRKAGKYQVIIFPYSNPFEMKVIANSSSPITFISLHPKKKEIAYGNQSTSITISGY